MPNAVKLSGLAVLFAAGVLFSATIVGGGSAAESATTEVTTTVEATTTETAEPTTVVETRTVDRTTTRIVPVPQTTTSTASDEAGTPAWVWVLLAILAAGLILLIVLLARRGGGTPTPSVEERRRQLDAAVATWTAQGWAIESETSDSAVLRRGADSMFVSVDSSGHVSTRPLPSA